MTKTLWRWSHARDDWDFVTTATEDKTKAVLRGYRRRDAKGVRFKWTDGDKPRRFRTRRKKGE